jgi:cellulose synthase/poly-beta-1,6-N-acetylglucosamine synthase-like glycosyltransferase
VTVAVPVKDRRERMLRCLEALLALDYPRFDVLVVDNVSGDRTAEACRERGREATVDVRVEEIEGTVGALRNRAAELARGEIVAFTDSDCAPAPEWLAEGVRPFVDPEVGVVQGRTEPEPGAEMRAWAATIEVLEWSGRYESANLLFRRSALLESDGFDEVVGHFWEDTAAGASLTREGWRSAFAPGALVYHDVTYPSFGWWLRRGLRYGNAARVVRRYPELRRALLWCRFFLRPRSAKFAAAAVGIALAKADRRALALAFPYAWERRPPGFSWRAIAFDAAIFAGMVKGSIRHRRLVL